jgi:hypothetical protein
LTTAKGFAESGYGEHFSFLTQRRKDAEAQRKFVLCFPW